MNTHKFTVKALMTLVLGLSFFSCKDYLDVNVDPNQSTTSRIDLQLTSAQLETAIGLGQRIMIVAPLWCQYYTGGPGVSLGDPDQHKLGSSESNEIFRELYRANNNLNFIIKNSDEKFYVAIAKIQKAYNFSICADLFGDIPYTEALNGDIADGSILHPHYDNAKDVVYPALIAELHDALGILADGGNYTHPGEDDLVYGGDLDQWAKFARTMLLKLHLRSGDYAGAAGLVDDYTADGFIVDDADNAMIRFPGGAAGSNPFWNTCKSTSLGNYYIATSTVLDHLNDTHDPRIDAFFDATSAGTHVGIDPGSIQAEPPGKEYSRPAGALAAAGGLIFSPTAPVIFMSAWEGNLLVAEAEARRNAIGAARDAYDNGVRASFAYLGIASPADDDYLADGGAMDTTSVDAMVKSIALQKWTCMNGLQPVESWIETRRFDGPMSLFTTGPDKIFKEPTHNALGAGLFPSILPYPENEESLNQNFAGQHSLTSKVFWDN